MDKNIDKKMDKKRRASSMLIPTIVMAVLAVILLYIGYSKGRAGPASHRTKYCPQANSADSSLIDFCLYNGRHDSDPSTP
jgi:hypothetical protein